MNRLFTPISIGKVTLKNRIVFAPTSLGRSGDTICERIAAGGCGLLILADLSVIPSMLGSPSLDSNRYEEYLCRIISSCHAHGCKVSAQLFHPEYDVPAIGRLYKEAREKGAVSPEKARAELEKSINTYCDSLTKPEIEAIIQSFAGAAKRAEEFGFDMVQIHGDRLTGSFTSPLFNHRKDEYSSHSYFPRELVKAIREAAPTLPLDYKLTIRMEEQGLGRGGISFHEIADFVQNLDTCGVNSYHVALANHTDLENTIPAKNHPILKEEGCFSALALEVKKYTENPVCMVGKLQHPDKIGNYMKKGIDLIGMSRQLIADPCWPDKVEAGDINNINYCLYCNKLCLDALKRGTQIGCVLHKEG